MSECVNCGAAVEPDWKFCIACGTPIAAATAEAVAPVIPPPVAPTIPHAIRPWGGDAAEPELSLSGFDDDEAPPKKRVDIALIVGVAMAAVGAVLIVLVAIIVFTPHN